MNQYMGTSQCVVRVIFTSPRADLFIISSIVGCGCPVVICGESAIGGATSPTGPKEREGGGGVWEGSEMLSLFVPE